MKLTAELYPLLLLRMGDIILPRTIYGMRRENLCLCEVHAVLTIRVMSRLGDWRLRVRSPLLIYTTDISTFLDQNANVSY